MRVEFLIQEIIELTREVVRYCYCEASSSASVVYVVRLRMLIFSMAALYKRGVPWNPMNPPWIRHCSQPKIYHNLIKMMGITLGKIVAGF